VSSRVSNRILFLACSATVFTGCSTISSWFPDKQKEYQYQSEIPPLEVPPDLTSSTIDGVNGSRRPSWESPASPDGQEPGSAVTARESTPAPGAEMTPESARALGESKAHPAPVLAESTQDDPLIEVQAPMDITWAEVNKALGRLKLEIIDENRSDGLFFVHYAGEAKAPGEGENGFFGDVASMFGVGPASSQEYRIKLQEKNKVTSIYVLNTEGKPQRSGPGLELLKQLNDTLQNTALGGKGEKPAS
jgi:outer membrane protein assembly factor BamC